MAGNPFDQFDTATSSNPFDQFDEKPAGNRSFLGASAESGGRSLLSTGARLADALNPFTTSDEEAATLFKDDPEGFKDFQARGAAGALSRFAREQAARAESVMKDVAPDATGAVSGKPLGELEYATMDPEKAAYLSPTRVAGDVLRSLPSTLALAVAGYMTRGRSLQAAEQAEAAALASGASAEVAKKAGRDAAVTVGAETMAKTSAIGEGAVGAGQQYDQALDEAMKVKPEVYETSPEYQALLEKGYDPEMARIALAHTVARNAAGSAGAVDALTNAAGGAVLGRVIGEGGKLVPRVAKGVGTEAATETVQSAGEQAGQNLAMRAANPGQDIGEGVMEAAVAGGVVGGVTGGAAAGVFGRPSPRRQAAEQQLATADNVADMVAAATELAGTLPEIDTELRGYLPTPSQIQPAPAESVAPAPQPEYEDLSPMTKLQAQQRLVVLRDQATDSGVEYAMVAHPASPKAFAIERARLPTYEVGAPAAPELTGPLQPTATDLPTAPPASKVVEALRTEPFQRDAAQNAALKTAAARLSSEDQAIVDKAAKGPFALSLEERNRLTVLNEGVKMSPSRAQDVLTAEAEKVKGSATVVNPATLPSVAQAQQNADGLQSLTKEVHGLVERVGKIFKKNIVLFDSKELTLDGFVRENDPDTIYLNVKASKPHLVLLGHEVTHQMKQQLGHAYTAFEQVVRAGLTKEGAAAHTADYGAGANVEELSSDLMGNRFQEPEFWGDVFAQIEKNLGPKAAVGVVQRLGALISKAVQSAKRAVFNAAGFNADEFVNNLEDVKKAARTALAEYAANRREAMGEQPRTVEGKYDTFKSPTRTQIGNDRTQIENNASGESAASLEAQSRLRGERAAGRERVLVERDGTVRPLNTVDGVDQRARTGQVLLQRGIGKDEWTVLDAGPGSNKAAAIARASADETKASARRDKQGAEYDVTVREELLGATKNERSVIVEARQKGERRGFVDFAVRGDGVLVAENAKVAPMLKGRGIAEMMYRAVRDAGYDIAPGRVQTDEGQRMVESLQRKGVINKDSDVPRFRAGDLDLAPIDGEVLPGEKATRVFASPKRAPGELPVVKPRFRAPLAAAAKGLTTDEIALLREDTATKMVKTIAALPETEEIAAIAWAGRAKRGWYKGSTEALITVFGADAPRFAALLAALSPQTGVESNLLNALQVWRAWDAAGRPQSPKAIRRIIGANVQGDKGEGSILHAWFNNSVSALTTDDPAATQYSGPKVNSFFQNLVGNVNEVTNDTWMANYALVSQSLFAGRGRLVQGKKIGGKGYGYLAMNSVVRQAAARLTELTGETWSPAEVQETVWSWAKALYEAQKNGQTASDILYNEELTDELINATPDFRTLFHDDTYAKIIEAAGLGEQLGRVHAETAERAAAARDEGQAAPFDPSTQARFEQQAAKRLEELKAVGKVGRDEIMASTRRPISVTGIHYSQAPRTILSSAYYGTGLKGAERERAAGPRIYFYVDEGNGIKPESGVGAYAHRARLENLYDAGVDPQYLNNDSSGPADFEAKVEKAGYAGYYIPNFTTTQGAAVLLGNHAVKVDRAGEGPLPPTGELPQRATREDTGFRAVLAQLAAAKDLPSGALTPARWLEVLPAEIGQPLRDAGVLEGTEPLYKNELAKAYKAAAQTDVKASPARAQLYQMRRDADASVSATARSRAERADRQAAAKPALLNIGLSTRELKGGGELNEDTVRAEIERLGVPVIDLVVHPSDTEPTAVVRIESPLTRAEATLLSVRLSQEAIVQRMPDGSGEMFGPKATEWGPYDAKFFVMPDGTRADAVKASPRRIVGDSGRTYTPAQKKMFSNTGRTVDVPTFKDRLTELRKDLGKKMAQGIADQFAPVKDITEKGYMLMRLSKGSSGAVEAFLHHGKLSVTSEGVYNADTSGGFIERLGVPLHGELEDFLWWVAANRSERLAAEGRENLFSAQDIAAGKSLAEGKTDFDYTLRNGKVTRDRSAIFADALKTFDEFNKNAMDVAEKSGLIDPEARKIWEHEFYVPFYRVSEDDRGFVGGNVKSGVVRQRAFKALKGGTDKLNSDLLSNTLQNWAHLIDASAKNRAAEATLEAAVNLGIATEADADTVRQMARSSGSRNSTVWFMDSGKERHFVVGDPYLLTALNGLEFAGLRGPLMDALSSFKHWLTVGVTASPAFKIRNLIRDSVQAVATSPLSYNIAGNLKEGFKASKRGTQPYVTALASGGLIRFGTMLEGRASDRVRQLVRMGVDESTILDSEDKIAHVRNQAEKLFMAYSEIGNRGEEINRSALFQQMRKQGATEGEAALAARDLLDFSMQGAWTSVRFFTQVVPFMNARIQGLYKLGKSAKDDPKRFAIVLGATALMSLSLLAMYHDDDDWKKREDWDRDNYWWFKIGGTAYRIPKPFEVGAVATLAERGVELFTDDEMTSKRFLSRVKQLVLDNLSMNPIPQAVKPILDVYANKDSFSGRPIETLGMERLRPDYRFTAGSSMPARAISTAGQTAAEAVGGNFMSPVQVDHLIRGYLGWLGSFAVGGADMVTRPLTNEPTRPTADYYKLASMGFISETPERNSRYITDLYAQAKELDQAYSTWQALAKQGKTAEAREFLEDNREAIVKSRRFDQVKQRESQLNERIRIVERSAMSPDDKKAELRRLAGLKDQLARTVAPGQR